jgi:GPI mannosyltransferase 3
VILASAVSDRLYFGIWTFPPYQWLNFNITQSLAIFYGKNRWDYYLTEALPLLLTTYLPFAVLALWSSSTSASGLPAFIANVRFQLAFVIITMVATLSVISHKEVRFIYPLLPSLHILTAPHILSFFNATPLIITIKNASDRAVISISSWRRYLLVALVLANLGISIYATQFHQRGVIDVLTMLRRLYDDSSLAEYSPPQIEIPGHRYKVRDPNETFAAFLMPCHSTPWRSHLVYSSLRAWALTCEPPLHIPANTPERAMYRDEADRFYDAPDEFLRHEVGTETRPWPRYVVGFEGIEGALRRFVEEAMPGKRLRRRWDLFNSHWHDDWRRVGRVVIWEFVQLEE